MKRVGGFAANADSTTAVIRRISDKGKAAEEKEKTLSKLLNINRDSIEANERIKNEVSKSDSQTEMVDQSFLIHQKYIALCRIFQNMLLPLKRFH